TVMWATLNGAFLLSGDQEFFRDVTGLDATSLLNDVFDFQLAAAHRLAKPAAINRAVPANGAVKEAGKGSAGAAASAAHGTATRANALH
ncbi:MAG: hypothetical protein ACREQN_12045, partial [Candidatus Binataceae bacterium]